MKVLDFGLAKALELRTATGDPSESPTMASPAMPFDGRSGHPEHRRGVTQAGIIVGTAAYMSPEQARGGAVDKRADIWAFGVVVFEMLTGRARFPGESVTDGLAAVVRAEPDWNALPAATPRHVREVLARCLRKDPKQRLRDIGDARLELLDGAAHDSGAERVVPQPPRVSGRRWLLSAGGLLTLVLSVIGLTIWRGPWWFQPKASAPVVRLALNLPAGQQLNDVTFLAPFDVSPDGTRIVYAARQGDRARLYLRALNRVDATPLPGTEGAAGPFFSPDGRSIAFFADARLKKAAVAGGPVQVICEVTGMPTGGSWGQDDQIIFEADFSGLRTVPAGGGTPKPLTQPALDKGEIGHIWPHLLPGNRGILFSILTEEARWIAVLGRDTGQWQRLVKAGGEARYLPTGRLIYQESTSLLAAPFDLAQLRRTSEPTLALELPEGGEQAGEEHLPLAVSATVLQERPRDAGGGARGHGSGRGHRSGSSTARMSPAASSARRTTSAGTVNGS